MAAAPPKFRTLLPCPNTINETLSFFTEKLGFRVNAIYPADNPRRAKIVDQSETCHIELASDVKGDPGIVVVEQHHDANVSRGLELTAPNGTRIIYEQAQPIVEIPSLIPERVHVKHGCTGDAESSKSNWIQGRAGMRYRDLIPGRLGGRYIASHIRIERGGTVPDYTHFHRVRFQMIYCFKGWVRVVYEDQGASFILRPGDCVIQPPTIRHQVLECSPGLEVVEIGCPAEHETIADHGMQLPNPKVNPARKFEGQTFVRHVRSEAEWHRLAVPGGFGTGSIPFETRTMGFADATEGIAEARVIRRRGEEEDRRAKLLETEEPARAEFQFWFVLAGSAKIRVVMDDIVLLPADSLVIPAHEDWQVLETSRDFELLEVCCRS